MINVLAATYNTPLATDLMVRSLLHFNQDQQLRILVGVADLEPDETISRLSKLPCEIYPHRTATHYEILNHLYGKVDSNHFLTIDSDIELLKPNVLSKMQLTLATEDVFVCGIVQARAFFSEDWIDKTEVLHVFRKSLKNMTDDKKRRSLRHSRRC